MSIRDIILQSRKGSETAERVSRIVRCITVGVDYTNSAAVRSRVGYAWVKEYGQNRIFQVFNHTGNYAVEQPVLVERSPRPPFMMSITGVDWETLAQNLDYDPTYYGGAKPGKHGWEHEWRDKDRGVDPVRIYMRALAPLQANVYSGLIMVILPGYYYLSDELQYCEGGYVDLTADLPGAGNTVRVMIYYNPADDSFYTLSSDEVALTGTPDYEYPPKRTLPVVWVQLNDGDTDLTEDRFEESRFLYAIKGLHHIDHENGGDDEIDVTGLSGLLTDPQDAGTLQGRDFISDAPANAQGIVWNAVLVRWEPGDVGNTSITGLPETGWVESGETWTYASTDDPTFTFTITGDMTTKYSPGMKIKLDQSTGGTKYFIITKVSYSNPDTTVTIYGGIDYNLENEAISNPYYSVVKAPIGFPLDPTKWTVEVTDTSQQTQATPTQNIWYNPGSISISVPIGIWRVPYKACGMILDATSTQWVFQITLSTANNSESDAGFTVYSISSACIQYASTFHVEKVLNLAIKTTYYLNIRTLNANLDNIYIRGDLAKTIIRAVCAYL